MKGCKLYANQTGQELSLCTCFHAFVEYCVLNQFWHFAHTPKLLHTGVSEYMHEKMKQYIYTISG